jgi:hypothetical protein
MALSAYGTSKPSIIIPTSLDITHRLLFIQQVYFPEQRQGANGAVEKARVDLAELVACEDTGWCLKG